MAVLPSAISSPGPGHTHRAPAARMDEIYAPIAADLQRVRAVFRQELASDQAFIDDLCRHVGQYHGKLLRPALVLLCGRACGGIRPEHHVLGAVVEMVHMATLVHDDVLDEADTRRRVETVNRMSGNERAVLLGDFLISHAFHLCSSLDSRHASRRIGATTNEVCEGELMQVANRGRLDLSEALYLEIIRRKTASLIGACCELGAWCSGADKDTTGALARFGVCLGVAFQIVDDVLDLTGAETVVGKTLGRDLEKGKLTLPLIRFRDARRGDGRCGLDGDGRARDRIAQIRDVLELDEPRRTREMLDLLRGSDALEYAMRIASDHVRLARESLASLPPSGTRDLLSAMADFVLTRQK